MPRNTNEDEKLLLLSDLVYDTNVLAKVSPQLNGDRYFETPPHSVIEALSFKYYSKYAKAPAENIESLVVDWANRNNRDKGQVDLVEKLTSRIVQTREDYKSNVHIEYSITRALELLKMRRAAVLADKLTDAIAGKNSEQVDELINSYIPVAVNLEEDDDPFSYDFVVNKVLTRSREKPLIKFDGDADKFFGNVFHRKGFVVFEGADKVGKSSFLMDVLWRAWLQRNRVVYYEAGDLGKEYAVARLVSRLCKRPIEPDSARDYKVYYPTALDLETITDKTGQKKIQYTVTRTLLEFPEALSAVKFKQSIKKLKLEKIRSTEQRIRIKDKPTKSLQVEEIRADLLAWKKQTWIPDLIVIDYADILAMPPMKDFRHATDDIWGKLRSLAIEFDCCVVSATQAKATAYGGKKSIGRDTFSEDKRKNAHISAKIGLMQTDDEKKKEIIRINMALRRDAPFDPRRELYCAGCLSMTNPMVRTAYAPNFKR